MHFITPSRAAPQNSDLNDDIKIVNMSASQSKTPFEPIKKTIKVKKIIKKNVSPAPEKCDVSDVSETNVHKDEEPSDFTPPSSASLQSFEIENTKPDYLAHVNAHERDQYISFDEGPHIYTVHGDTSFMSVTTWNHSHFEAFDADGIARKILKNPKWKKDPEYKYYQKTLEEIKAMWSSTEASEAGTKMHYDIECYYNGLDVKNDSIEYKYFLDFAKDYEHLEPYRTEWCVYYEELKLSGSIDMVFRDKNTGEFYIYDWKRSKGISYEGFAGKKSHVSCITHLDDCNFWHYSLQLNTYRAILEEKYNMKISGMYLIVLHPDNPYNTYDRIQCHDLRKEISDLFELRRQQVINGTDKIHH